MRCGSSETAAAGGWGRRGYAAKSHGHQVTLIVGTVSVAISDLQPPDRHVDVETAREMREAVLRKFPAHDLLLMSAAVADFRPVRVDAGKLPRGGELTIVCEPTEDILTAVGDIKRADQRVVGFSLEEAGQIERARQKMVVKKCDLMVFNPLGTMNSENIEATLLCPDGRTEPLGRRSKWDMGQALLSRAEALFDQS